ncbi:MAG TPA: hypothetical protein VFO18_03615 [Methylomirabilota bacterium]|nr:hypothetical protein [Methylomirabilota bacterium]
MRPNDLSTALWAAAGWVAFAVAAHFAVFRLVQVERRARTLVSLWGVALMGFLWTSLMLEVERWRIVFGGVALFSAFILYLPFYYTVAASQSVRMLIELAREPDGLTITELRERNPVEEVLFGRLETLLAAGYLIRQGPRVALAPKARVIVGVFRFVRSLWRLGPGG